MSWNYPKELTGKPYEISDMGNTNASKKRQERRAWRKAVKAKRHAELLKKK